MKDDARVRCQRAKEFSQLQNRFTRAACRVWGAMEKEKGRLKTLSSKQLLAGMQNPELRKQFAAMGLAPSAHGAAAFAKDWIENWVWISKADSEAKLDTH